MQPKTRWRLADFAFIFVLGLAPLLWFEPGAMLKGLDFDLPLTWERMKFNFFYIWDYQNGAGLPRNLHHPALMFFLPQALLHKIGFSLEAIQRIFFCFWFMLPGFAFYYLMRSLVPGKEEEWRPGIWVAVSFYMFNLYLEPIWLGFNMANLSAYVAVPLALGVLIRALHQRRGAFPASLKVGLSFFFFPAMATNPSMTFIAALPFPILALWHLFRERWSRPATLFVAKLAGFSLLSIFVFNAYWIFPEIKKLFDANLLFETAAKTEVSVADNVFFAHEWVTGISRFTSLPNVLKMQGDWPWYQGFREYAKLYWSNPLLQTLAWLPFALTLLAILKVRHPYKRYFVCVWLVGILFGMGSHPPFGFIYMWLFDHLPLFWTIRSPWYKFTLLTCIGYGVLIGMGAQWLLSRVRAWRWRPIAVPLYATLLCFLVAASPVYSFPLIEGKMYRKPTPENSYSNHFKIPPHVREAADWLNPRLQEGRVWDLPCRGISYNKWGYEGFLPLIGYFIHAPLIGDNHPLHIPYHGAWSSAWMPLAKMTRNAVERGLTPYLTNLLRMLQIKYVLQEGDFRYEVLPFPVTREEINRKCETLVGVRYAKSFTEAWDLWEVDRIFPSVYHAPKVSVVNESINALVPLSTRFNPQKLPAHLFLSDIDVHLLQTLYEKNLIEEVVQFENTFLDWAIQSLDTRYLHRFVNDPEKGWRQEFKRNIEISEPGEYLILSRKKVPIRITPIRVEVDFTNIPQSISFRWNQGERYPLWNWTPEGIESLKQRTRWRLGTSGALCLIGLPVGLYFDAKPFIYLMDGYWHLGGAKRKKNPLFKMFKVNGEVNFHPDPQIQELWRENPSWNWQYLGSQHLNEGPVQISALATVRHRSQWDFFVVPKFHFLEATRLARRIFSDSTLSQVCLFASTSNWDSDSKIEQKNYRFTEKHPIGITLDHRRKRGIFSYQVADDLYDCYQGNQLVFWVTNPVPKKMATNLTFEILLFQTQPGTVTVLLNDKKVQEFIAEPMEKTRIYVKNITLPPGKNKLEIASFSKVNTLGDILGNEETKKACFGYRDLKFGELIHQQKFYLPAGRFFEVRLYPFFERKQTKAIWKEAVLASEIKIDGKKHLLEKVYPGTEKVYLRLKEPIPLGAGVHEVEYAKVGDEEYFLLLESPSEKPQSLSSGTLEWKRLSATRVDVRLSSTEPGFLIFSDSFDPKWRAQAKGGSLKPHLKVNGFANAYFVEGKGKEEIVIEYTPQKHFIAGVWTTAVGGAGLLLLGFWKRRRRQR